ncbi:MAG: phosphoesterase PA-phosphatase related protein, partial [Thermomicrobiales bacterium]|nr:phosphoesterase PA-phosphatase related protein [Thermomicrobiales bacterium]
MSTPSHASPRVSRRLLVGSSLAGAALLPLASGPRAAVAPPAAAAARVARRQETAASPAGWRTWLLSSPDELRPAAPGAPTQAEIDEVVAAQTNPSEETVAAITHWGSGPAVIPWSRLAGEVFDEFDIGGMPLGRVMAIVHTALHDAAIAAWDAQVAYARPSPGATGGQITPEAGVEPDRPSFPSEHAAV